MSDNNDTFERGDSFETHSDPNVDETVILEIDQISGYRAVRVAEKRNGEWLARWIKESYLHDEVNLRATSQVEPVGEERLASLEGRVSTEQPSAPAAPERVASLD